MHRERRLYDKAKDIDFLEKNIKFDYSKYSLNIILKLKIFIGECRNLQHRHQKHPSMSGNSNEEDQNI